MDDSLKRSRPIDDEEYAAQGAKKMRRALTDCISDAELLEALAERLHGNTQLRADVLALLNGGADATANGYWDGTTPSTYFAPSLENFANEGESKGERSPEMSPPPLSPIFSPEIYDMIPGADYAFSPIQQPTSLSSSLAPPIDLGSETAGWNVEDGPEPDLSLSPTWTPSSPEYIPQSPTYSPISPMLQPQSPAFEESSTLDSTSSQVPLGPGSQFSPTWTPSLPEPHLSISDKHETAPSGKRQKISHAPDHTEAAFLSTPDTAQEVTSIWSSVFETDAADGQVLEPSATLFSSQMAYAFPGETTPAGPFFPTGTDCGVLCEGSKKRSAQDDMSDAQHQAKKTQTSFIEQALASSTPSLDTQQFGLLGSTLPPPDIYFAGTTPATLPELSPLSHLQALPAELRTAIYSYLGLTTAKVSRGVSYLGCVRKAHAETQNAWVKILDEHQKCYNNPPSGTEEEYAMMEEWKKHPAYQQGKGPLVFAADCKHHFRTGNAKPEILTYDMKDKDPVHADIHSVLALAATSKFFHNEINEIIFDTAPILSVRIPDLDTGLDNDAQMVEALLRKMPWNRFPASTTLTISFEEAQYYSLHWDHRTRFSKDRSLALLDEVKTVMDYLKDKVEPKDLFIVLPALRDTEKFNLTDPVEKAVSNIRIGRAARDFADQLADWDVDSVNFGGLDSGFFRETAEGAGKEELRACVENVLRLWCGKGEGETSKIMDIGGPVVFDI